jgi:amino acid permease
MAHHAYQQMPADEPPDDGSINPQAPAIDPSFGDGGTKRNLQERQWVILHRTSSVLTWYQLTTNHSLSMIALAGMIGTGLFLSSGSALAQAGPLGCVFGFIVVSVFCRLREYLANA